MTFTAERAPAAQQGKTVNVFDVVDQQFREKVGFKRRIIWLFKAGAIDCLRVNYLNLENSAQIESYWVEVNNGKIIERN